MIGHLLPLIKLYIAVNNTFEKAKYETESILTVALHMFLT